MLRRRLQDLTYCISYSINFLHDKAHGAKQFRKHYTMLEELGRGGFGIVYKAERNEDGAPVAVKFIEHKRVREWTMRCKQLIPTEICLLDLCRDVPGVVQLIDWFANSKGFLIVMERPEQCMDLFDLISAYGYLDESIARSIFLQILNTTCLLYSTYGIFHRDIKDENIIINMHTGEATLVDFGAAALNSEACIKEFQGTRSYCPPEWFKRLAYMPLEATVWSLGIVLYVMVSGCLPFQNEIQICLGRLIIPKHVSKDCENLLRQCLAVTPSRRPDLLEICKHHWLNQPITVHSEPFKEVLDRRLREKLEAQRQAKQLENTFGKADSTDGRKNVFGCNGTAASPNERAAHTKRSTSNDISTTDSPVMPLSPHVNNVLSSELLRKHRRRSSYDNVVMSIRTDMFALRDCYDADNNVLISPSSIEEESSEAQMHSDSYSICESFSMISTDPQYSEQYVTAEEDNRKYSFDEKEVASADEMTSKVISRRTLPINPDLLMNRNAREVVRANGSDRLISREPSQAIMNSRLVAKHWPRHVEVTSENRLLNLQRPSRLQREQQYQQNQASVANNGLRMLSHESQQPVCTAAATEVAR